MFICTKELFLTQDTFKRKCASNRIGVVRKFEDIWQICGRSQDTFAVIGSLCIAVNQKRQKCLSRSRKEHFSMLLKTWKPEKYHHLEITRWDPSNWTAWQITCSISPENPTSRPLICTSFFNHSMVTANNFVLTPCKKEIRARMLHHVITSRATLDWWVYSQVSSLLWRGQGSRVHNDNDHNKDKVKVDGSVTRVGRAAWKHQCPTTQRTSKNWLHRQQQENLPLCVSWEAKRPATEYSSQLASFDSLRERKRCSYQLKHLLNVSLESRCAVFDRSVVFCWQGDPPDNDLTTTATRLLKVTLVTQSSAAQKGVTFSVRSRKGWDSLFIQFSEPHILVSRTLTENDEFRQTLYFVSVISCQGIGGAQWWEASYPGRKCGYILSPLTLVQLIQRCVIQF